MILRNHGTIGRPSMPKMGGRMDERMNERETCTTRAPQFFSPRKSVTGWDLSTLVAKVVARHCHRKEEEGVRASFSPTFGYFNWPRVSEQISQDAASAWFTGLGREHRAQRGKKPRASFLRRYPEVDIGLLNGEGIGERARRYKPRVWGPRWPRDKNGATRGRGNYLDLACEGEGKNGGEGGTKKERNAGEFPFFFFFFFSSHGGHVQNLNHPGPRFVLLAARYRADFAPPRNFERSHANSASLRRHDNDCEPVLGLTGPWNVAFQTNRVVNRFFRVCVCVRRRVLRVVFISEISDLSPLYTVLKYKYEERKRESQAWRGKEFLFGSKGSKWKSKFITFFASWSG